MLWDVDFYVRVSIYTTSKDNVACLDSWPPNFPIMLCTQRARPIPPTIYDKVYYARALMCCDLKWNRYGMVYRNICDCCN